MQRSIINYSEKSVDCILKSTKLICPVQGTSLLAEGICLAQAVEQVPVPTLGVLSLKEMGAEVQMGWGDVPRW